MKTLLSTLLLLTAVFSIHAAEYNFIPKWNNFTEQDKKFLTETTTNRWDSIKAACLIQEAAKSNPKIYTDVDDFEKAWEEVTKTAKTAFQPAMVLNTRGMFSKTILLHVHRKWIDNPHYYVKYYFPVLAPEITQEAFNGSYYKMFEKALNEKKFIGKKCVRLKMLVELISRHSARLTPEEELKLLKLIKRNYYKNIQKSEEWKTVMVEVELQIKALE